MLGFLNRRRRLLIRNGFSASAGMDLPDLTAAVSVVEQSAESDGVGHLAKTGLGIGSAEDRAGSLSSFCRATEFEISNGSLPTAIVRLESHLYRFAVEVRCQQPAFGIHRLPNSLVRLPADEAGGLHAMWLPRSAGPLAGFVTVLAKPREATSVAQWRPGQRRQIGSYVVSYRWAKGCTPAGLVRTVSRSANGDAHQNQPVSRIALVDRRNGRMMLRLKSAGRLSLFGQSPACQVIIRDRGVGWVQGAIIETVGGAWVVNLGATSMVEMNSRPIHQIQPLQLGDSLRVGQHEFMLVSNSSGSSSDSVTPPLLPLQSLQPEPASDEIVTPATV